MQDGITFFMEKGALKWGPHLSNDAGLGEGEKNRFVWGAGEYSPATFFRQWLRLTAVANKLPHDPYRLAFLTGLVPENGTSLEEFLRLSEKVRATGLVFLFVRSSSHYDLFNPSSFDRTVIGTHPLTSPS